MSSVLTRPAVRPWTVATRLLLLVVVATVAYTAVVTAFGQIALPAAADGSLVTAQGRVVGSSLLGQSFTGRRWFQSRPSATGYDGAASGASNLGPDSAVLEKQIAERRAAYLKLNGPGVVPADALTASASGLDPDISVENALRQVDRVAAARGLSAATVRALVVAHEQHPLFEQSSVDVLTLNLALSNLR